MPEVFYVPGDTTVLLHVDVLDNATPANNPITGLTVHASIRRLSDNKWWDATNSEWDTVAYGALTTDHQIALADRGDGSYETTWDQATADGSAVRSYIVVYRVTAGVGWVGSEAQDTLTPVVQETLTDLGWTAQLATRLGYLFLGVGVVETASGAATGYSFYVTPTSGGYGQANLRGAVIQFTSGNLAGESAFIIDSAQSTDMPFQYGFLVAPAFSGIPANGNAYVVIRCAPPSMFDMLLGVFRVSTVRSQTDFDMSIVQAPGAFLKTPTDSSMTGLQIARFAPNRSYPFEMKGASRIITAYDGPSGPVAIDEAFDDSVLATNDLLWVFGHAPSKSLYDAVAALGPGTGENVVTVTVRDGTSLLPLSGAVVHVRATSGGEDLVAQTTDTNGKVIVNLDDATLKFQAQLNGYDHDEQSVVVSTNPQAVTLNMTAITPTAAADPDAIRVYMYPRDVAGALDTDTSPPLFTVRLSRPCNTADGLIADMEKAATLHDDGYWWIDCLPVELLTPTDGGDEAPTYVWGLRDGTVWVKSVNDTDDDPSNLIDLD